MVSTSNDTQLTRTLSMACRYGQLAAHHDYQETHNAMRAFADQFTWDAQLAMWAAFHEAHRQVEEIHATPHVAMGPVTVDKT